MTNRDLDERVAELLKWVQCGDGWCREGDCDGCTETTYFGDQAPPPPWSTSLDAAMELWPELREAGWECGFFRRGHRHFAWVQEPWHLEGRYVGNRRHADNPEELAARITEAWVEMEEGGDDETARN